jgi:hypothetical protein
MGQNSSERLGERFEEFFDYTICVVANTILR